MYESFVEGRHRGTGVLVLEMDLTRGQSSVKGRVVKEKAQFLDLRNSFLSMNLGYTPFLLLPRKYS